jgi:hypothetical protein
MAAGEATAVGAAVAAAGRTATLATGAADERAVAGACVAVASGGAAVEVARGGTGVQTGSGVGLGGAVAVGPPSKEPMIATTVGVAVGGADDGEGDGEPLAAGVPAGMGVCVAHAGVASVAAPAALPDQPISTIRMPVATVVATSAAHRHPRVVSPCMPAPSFVPAAPPPYTMPNDARLVKSGARHATPRAGRPIRSRSHRNFVARTGRCRDSARGAENRGLRVLLFSQARILRPQSLRLADKLDEGTGGGGLIAVAPPEQADLPPVAALGEADDGDL